MSFMVNGKYLRKDSPEDIANPYRSIEIHVLLGASGDMFLIKGLVENIALNAICEF